VERAAPDKITPQLLDVCGDRLVSVGLGITLAPTTDASIGINLNE
jgi:hypothetical protein